MIIPKKRISSTVAGSPVRKSQTSSFTETGSAVAKGRDEPGERYRGEFFPIDHVSSTLATKTTEHEFDILLNEPNPDSIRTAATPD